MVFKQVYNIRKIDKSNFNPMVHNLMDKGFLKDCIQIYVDVVGGREWITIHKKDLPKN